VVITANLDGDYVVQALDRVGKAATSTFIVTEDAIAIMVNVFLPVQSGLLFEVGGASGTHPKSSTWHVRWSGDTVMPTKWCVGDAPYELTKTSNKLVILVKPECLA
jgi:hypothetical protein